MSILEAPVRDKSQLKYEMFEIVVLIHEVRVETSVMIELEYGGKQQRQKM
jgi:hypothetical protein